MRKYIVVGLDFSLTSPGVAALEVDEAFNITVKGMDSVKTKADEAWFARLDKVYKCVRQFVAEHKPKSVFVENYSFGSTNGREVAGEVHGVCLFNLIQAGYPADRIHRVISPQGLKKFVAGKGSTRKKPVLQPGEEAPKKVDPKQEMVDWANARFGLALKLKDHDMADALALAYVGIHITHFEELKDRMTEKQIEVVDTILNPKPKKRKTKKKTGGKNNGE